MCAFRARGLRGLQSSEEIVSQAILDRGYKLTPIPLESRIFKLHEPTKPQASPQRQYHYTSKTPSNLSTTPNTTPEKQCGGFAVNVASQRELQFGMYSLRAPYLPGLRTNQTIESSFAPGGGGLRASQTPSGHHFPGMRMRVVDDGYGWWMVCGFQECP